MEKGWTEVFLTGHEYKAAMAKDILENAGLMAVIMDQHDSSYRSFGDYLVYVEDRDVEKALELLKDLKR